MGDEAILRASLFTPGPRGRWGQPMRIVGQPGTAKTDIIRQVANKSGLPVVVVLASLRDPTDFLGLPVARPDGSVGYAPPDWAVEVAAAGRAVVFFDEINTASPAVQAALLRVVLDRVVGSFQLPPGVRILAAQNGVDEAAGGYDVAMPLANRFGTLADWSGPTTEAWCSWLLGESLTDGASEVADDASQIESRVLSTWTEAYSTAAAVVSTFMTRKPSLLHSQPPAGSPQASLPWPSRRTWAMATRALAASRIHTLTETDTDRYVGSFVGLAAVSELRSFMANLDLPDPAALLDGKIVWKHDKDRLDRTMAVLSSCAGILIPKDAPRRQERAVAFWSIVREVAKKSADVAWPTVRRVCERGLGLARNGKKLHDDASAVLDRFHPMLAAAGVIANQQK
jgi:hypothetical protein